jgi:hypothetical protein
LLLRLLLAALLCLPTVARAEWREAVSRHFIVYSEGSEQTLRQAASDLEKYDFLLRQMLDAPDNAPAKLKIYLMLDMFQVQQTMGTGTGNGVAGYYNASPRGPIAVGLRRDLGGRGYEVSNEVVLYHEYAHHLMLQYFEAAFPRWYSEGFAEYYGMTQILPGNVIEVGRPATHRLTSLRAMGEWVPLKEVLSENFKVLERRWHLVYSQGWLLIHYLADNPARKGQLHRYLTAINRGIDRKTAMNDAFGADAAELDKELRVYAKKRSFDATRITFPALDVGPIQLRTLGPAEQALMRHEIALGRGILAREAADFAKDVRQIARKYPDDPRAFAALTEAEYLTDNWPDAHEAVGRWLTLEPSAPRALAYKGLIEAGELSAADVKDKERWASAIKWATQARAAGPKDPFVLEAFYDVHSATGELPPARAQNALYRAMEMVPRDDELRQKVARDFERRGLIAEAIFAIQPAAYRAHDPNQETKRQRIRRERWEDKWREAGKEKVESPREMLARLEKSLAAMAEAGSSETAAAN